MKEHPIIFSTEMVKAILSGNKTQTRRVVKSPSWWEGHLIHAGYNSRYYDVLASRDGGIQKDCPYGLPGARLWVKETFVYDAIGEMPESEDRTADVEKILGHGVHLKFDTEMQMQEVTYRADESDPDAWNWKPSIFMPRWASRITLEITNIRVERVQEISDKDCEAEGVRPSVDGDAKDWLPNESGWKRTYRQLWNKINGKRKGCSWEENPYVWVIEFQKI